MANTGELLINVVTEDKPKMLKGLSQKGTVDRSGPCPLPRRRHDIHRRRGRTYATRVRARNVVSPLFSRKGQPTARDA
jgi:hypothetical protein